MCQSPELDPAEQLKDELVLLRQQHGELQRRYKAREARLGLLERDQRLVAVCEWELSLTSQRLSVRGGLGTATARVTPAFRSLTELASSIPEDERVLFHQQLELAQCSGEGFSIEHSLQLDGVKYSVRHVCELAKSTDGRPLKILGLMIDISELRAAEGAARDASKRAEELRWVAM